MSDEFARCADALFAFCLFTLPPQFAQTRGPVHIAITTSEA